MSLSKRYRGRLAPSPTGFLHIGHARTFYTAYQRAVEAGGVLLYREENLDAARCKPEFSRAAVEDLHWLGIQWQEPIVYQSERLPLYQAAFDQLKSCGFVYPCTCSRKDVATAALAPHEGDEPIYPGTCRQVHREILPGMRCVWRFRVPDGEGIPFEDGYYGHQEFVAGKDFGDFIVWRQDNFPAYQLAVVVDDVAMQITEIVRGADLLVSTARQILLYRALGYSVPRFYHVPLVKDTTGKRLAKRTDALAIRTLRERGLTPKDILEGSYPFA